MNKEFFEALELLAKEKGLSTECIAEKIKEAIEIALKKMFPNNANYAIVLDMEKKEFRVTVEKIVVDQVENPSCEITLKEAKKIDKKAKISEPVTVEIEPEKFGRIAVQNAKLTMQSSVREAEVKALEEKLGDKIGTIANAKVVSINPRNRNAMVEIDGNEFMLFRTDQLPCDRHMRPGDIIKVYIVRVCYFKKRCSLKISRTHSALVQHLFEMQVPEIEDGIVDIKGVSREPGFRTKIAVYSNQENVDPVGACIGPKNTRINAILEEIGNEKIDIITYTDDPAKYIARALAPAKVLDVKINEEDDEKKAIATVPDHQLALAIGNRGQNVRLAARLSGYKIDVQPESGFYVSPKNGSDENKENAEEVKS